MDNIEYAVAVVKSYCSGYGCAWLPWLVVLNIQKVAFFAHFIFWLECKMQSQSHHWMKDSITIGNWYIPE